METEYKVERGPLLLLVASWEEVEALMSDGHTRNRQVVRISLAAGL